MIWNAILLALSAIRRNVLRSILTVLGVIIGVAAVITMVTIGNGATASVAAQINTLGEDVLTLTPGQQRGPTSGPRAEYLQMQRPKPVARCPLSVPRFASRSLQIRILGAPISASKPFRARSSD